MKRRVTRLERVDPIADRLESEKIRGIQERLSQRLKGLTIDQQRLFIAGLSTYELRCSSAPSESCQIDFSRASDELLHAIVALAEGSIDEQNLSAELAAEFGRLPTVRSEDRVNPAGWLRRQRRKP